MREGWRGTRTCFLLFIREETKERRIFLDFTSRTSKYVCVSHRDRKSDCKRVCVKDVFPHLYTWCPKISTFWDVFPQKTWNRACVSPWKYQNGKGKWLSFQLSSPIVLGNAYVLKTCFFLCFLKAEIRSCFSRSSSPEPLFLPETPQISRSKAKETTCSGKNGTFQNHMTIAQKITTNLNAKKHTTTDLT